MLFWSQLGVILFIFSGVA